MHSLFFDHVRSKIEPIFPNIESPLEKGYRCFPFFNYFHGSLRQLELSINDNKKSHEGEEASCNSEILSPYNAMIRLIPHFSDGVKAGDFSKVMKGAVGASNTFGLISEGFPVFKVKNSFVIEDALQGDSFNGIGADKLPWIRILGLKPRIVPQKGDLSTLQN